MKKILLTLFFIFAANSALAAGNFAVVDIQKVSDQSKAAVSLRDYFKKKIDDNRQEIGKKEDALRKEEQDLTSKRSSLSQEEFKKKNAAFKDKVTKIQKEIQQKQASFDKSSSKAFSEVNKTIADIVAGIAKEKGFDLVFPSSLVLFSKEGLDITDEVINKLNDKLPKVTVTE